MGNSQDGFERKNSTSGEDSEWMAQWLNYFTTAEKIMQTGIALNDIKQTLKPETMKKEITGYKLKDEKYLKAVIAITKLDGLNYFNPNTVSLISATEKPTLSYVRLKEAGVLDLWFEPVYKEEPELEVGKWYKHIGAKGTAHLFAYKNLDRKECYGFEGEKWVNCHWTWPGSEGLTPATSKEVKAALQKEARKRYKVGDKVICLFDKEEETITDMDDLESYSEFQVEACSEHHDNDFSSAVLFKDGQWAEIISEPKEYEKSYRDILEILSELPTDDLKELNLQITEELKKR